MPYSYIGDIDLNDIKFSKMYTSDGKMRVDISMKNNKKFIFQLCSDAQEPYSTRYALDQVRDDAADKTRRGQAVLLEEEKTLKAMEQIDELVMKAAIANSADWFKSKTPLSEETIRDRYQKTVFRASSDDETGCVKFKVKVNGAKVPTRLHRTNGDGNIVEDKGRVKDLERRGGKVAPVLSSFGLWFMGGKDPSKYGISYQAEELIVTPGETKPLSSFASKRPFSMAASVDADPEEEAPSPKREKIEEDDGVAM